MSDSIRKVNRRDCYTTVNNDFLHDKDLTWKAKGLIVYIMSLPPDWELNVSDLKNRSKDGRDATAAGIRELIENRYCRRIRSRDKGGVFAGFDYEVSDIKFDPEPQTDFPYMVEPQTGFPFTDKPETDKPETENPTQVNTNYNKDPLIVNTNNSGEPRGFAPLFPDAEQKIEIKSLNEDKSKKTLFRNSKVYSTVDFNKLPLNYSEFEKLFSRDGFEKIDLVYYFHVVSDWSDQKDVKRTKVGWIATVRNFIRGDVDKNKVKLKKEFKPESQKLDVNAALDYLTEYND